MISTTLCWGEMISMGLKKYFLIGLVSVILLVSVFSAGIAFSAGGTEDEIALLVHKRHGTPGLDYFRSNHDYELVEDYDSFMLIETSEENAAFLQESDHLVEKVLDRDHVALHSYSFNTGDGEPDLPEELRIESYEKSENGYYIVQFIGPIKPEWRDTLEEMDVVLHDYRYRYNLIVEMDKETKEDLEGLEFINWIGIYQPAYSFDQDILERSSRVSLDITLFEGADVSTIATAVSSHGGEIESIVGRTISAEMEPDQIIEIANLDGVRSITEGTGEYRFMNADATWVTQTNREDDRKVTEHGITGRGELITVMDSGVSTSHQAFHDPDNEIGDLHRKVQDDYVPEGGDGDTEAGLSHGTHVAGTVLGESLPYGEYSNQDGNALEARLISQDVSTDGMSIGAPPDMYNDAFGDVYDRGSRIHTNSWGSRGAGDYAEQSALYDEFLWDHKDFNLLFAAGNDGPMPNSISPQASAKNVIGVGAVQNVDAAAPPRGGGYGVQDQIQGSQDNMADFSSRGYTADGRIAPTILHVGEGVISASDTDDDGYASMSGTSMSCPGIAGQAGQIRQYYQEGWYPSGSENPGDGFNPSGALVRATLINGAVEISGNGAYQNDERFPNNDQGFGRSMLDRALHFEGDDRNLEVFDSWNQGVELSTGESWDMTFEVDDPSEELEVTLVWTDPPASPGADPTIVNDLDLEMTGPAGDRYVGNAFTGFNPGYSEPNPNNNPWEGGRDAGFDGLNVEQNILLLPDHNGVESGTYEVTVSAHNVPEGSQPFAVVVSGGVSLEPGPQGPTDPEPEHESFSSQMDTELSVDVEHDEGDSMDVTFYDASDGSVIGTDSNVASGTRAVTTWEGLEQDTTYRWYAVAEDDNEISASSSIWSFETGETNFEVGIIVEDVEVAVGKEVVGEYTVTNTGDFEGEQEIEFRIDGELDHSEEITLGPQEEYEYEFTWTTEDLGVYDLSIHSEDDEEDISVSVLEPPYFEVEIKLISPDGTDEFVEDGTATIEYEVENTGDLEDEQEIQFTVNGDVEDSVEVFLDGDDIYEGEFVWSMEEPGEHEIVVSSVDHEDDAEVKVLMDAYFEVEITSPGPDEEFDVGEDVIVEYKVTNIGEVEGTHEVEFYLEDEFIDAYEVTLGGGEEYIGEFYWEAEEEGVFESSLIAADEDASVQFSVEDPFPWWMILIVLMIVVVFLVLIVVFKDRDEKEEEETPPKPPGDSNVPSSVYEGKEPESSGLSGDPMEEELEEEELEEGELEEEELEEGELEEEELEEGELEEEELEEEELEEEELEEEELEEEELEEELEEEELEEEELEEEPDEEE